jgi:uncharacterized protein
MDLDLRGKTAVLTGGSRGIGKALAVELAKNGVRICAAARDEEKLAQTKSMVEDAGGTCITLPCDVTDDASVKTMVTQAALVLDGMDIFLNVAGITLEKSLLEATPEDFIRVMDTNLLGYLRCAQAALPHLRQSRGLLVNIASTIARVPFPFLGVYACSKWAVAAFSSILRQELHGSGVRVLTVYPSMVRTDMLDETPVLAGSAYQPMEECVGSIIKAIRKGKTESYTSFFPWLLGLYFYFMPGLGDIITRFYLPRHYKIRI